MGSSTSKSESPCCPPDSAPPLAESSTPADDGVMEHIEGTPPLTMWCTRPLQSASRAVVVYSDVWGPESAHHRRFCSQLNTALGDEWTVALPDLFRGNPPMNPPMQVLILGVPGMLYRLRSCTKETVIERDVANLIVPHLRRRGVSGPLACAGFCFGGWCVAQSLALQETPFACGVGIHPSLNVEQIFGRKDIELAHAVGATPLLLLPARNDSPLVKPAGECVAALAAARSVAPDVVSVEFPDMTHGWCSRGDDADPAVARDQKLAIDMTAKFCLEHTRGAQ